MLRRYEEAARVFDDARRFGREYGISTLLARAIASKENPLTARVIVNRVWKWHFGTGLVNSANASSSTEYTLIAIAAVVLGGTSIFGGTGSVHGTLLGVAAFSLAAGARQAAALRHPERAAAWSCARPWPRTTGSPSSA